MYLLQVGALKKGINPLSINRITFDPKYIAGPLKGGVVTAMIAIAVRYRNLSAVPLTNEVNPVIIFLKQSEL